MGKNKRKYPDQSEEDKIKNKLAKLQKQASKPDSPLVKEIKEKAAAVVENRRNANNILEILEHLHLEEPAASAGAAVQAVKRIFSLVIEKHGLSETKEETEEMTSDEKYKVWVSLRYQETLKKLSQLIHHPKASISNLSIATLMSFVSTHWSSQEATKTSDWGSREREVLNNILLSIISNKHQSSKVISRFQEFLLYVDVKFHFLKLLSKVISVALKGEKTNNIFVENVFGFLEAIGMDTVEGNTNTFICKNLSTGESSFKLDWLEMKKYYGNCWMQILKTRITMDQYKRVLIILDTQVLPYVAKPLLLTDFLVSSYNVGGSISLLALSGVFTLISKYNLEYPEFYTKLYQLFTPELLHVKYRARFFQLADIFLSSSHLPAYLVAAFIKRLARLSLSAPSPTIPMVVRFIHNLIHRHPSLVKMIDNEDTTMLDDPFDNSEKDPAKSNAIGSSLWEIKSLEEHLLPQVSSVAKDLIEKGLREMELDFASHLENSYEEMFEKETKKKIFTNVPVNWDSPDGLKMKTDDIFSQIVDISA